MDGHSTLQQRNPPTPLEEDKVILQILKVILTSSALNKTL